MSPENRSAACWQKRPGAADRFIGGTPMRSRTKSSAALAAITIAASAGLVAFAAPAQAAQSELALTCDGQHIIVRVPTSNSGPDGGWSVGQIVAGTGHGVPTAFSGSLVDHAVNQTLFTFEQAKGGGKANHNQSTIDCTASQTGVLEDFLEPGQTPPPGTSLSDPATFTLMLTVVPHF
jgi:hypothetical protein